MHRAELRDYTVCILLVILYILCVLRKNIDTDSVYKHFYGIIRIVCVILNV
jgi:hypothetical protein